MAAPMFALSDNQHPEMDIVPHDLPAKERPMKIDTMTPTEYEALRVDILGMLEDRETWTGPDPDPRGDDECDIFLRTRHPIVYGNYEMTYMQIRDQRIPKTQLIDFLDGLRSIVYGAKAGDKQARRKIYDQETLPRDWYAFARGITPHAYDEAMRNAMLTDEGKRNPDRVRTIMIEQWKKARLAYPIDWDTFLTWQEGNKIAPMTPSKFAANLRTVVKLHPEEAKVNNASAREAWGKRWILVDWSSLAQGCEPMEYAAEVRAAKWLTIEADVDKLKDHACKGWESKTVTIKS
jgi:hypothetical protein